jgi:AraC family transcriptional activator of mtrCDE
MDLLSRLLNLMPVHGRVDVRCQLGAPWDVAHDQAGVREIPYHVCLAGEAVLEDEHGAPITIGPGDIVLFPRGAAHRLHDGSGKKPRPVQVRETPTLRIKENKSSAPGIDLLCGTFLVANVQDRLLRDHLPDRLVVSMGRMRSDRESVTADPVTGSDQQGAAGTALPRLVALMRDEASGEQPGAKALLDYLSGALFAMTLRFASESDAPPQGLLALARHARLQPALAAMFDSPEQEWTLPSLAALCNMSRATFVRHFEASVGRSASEVLTEVRMTLAARQLTQTDLPTAAIGEAVGYHSEAAFQRAFKQQLGMTPARWRAASASRAAAGSEVTSPASV